LSLGVAMSPELSLVFPTPILSRTLFNGAFNEKLARIILARRRHGEGSRLNGGGWQSASDLLSWPELEVKLLASEIVAATQRISAAPDQERVLNSGLCGSVDRNHLAYRGRAWANVNGDGHYNAARLEPDHQWCAIYHVSTGRLAPDRVMNGMLEIMDPRPAAAFGHIEKFAFGQPLEIEPKPGLVVIFPAWLHYSVHPFFGMGHRISITLNITLKED